MVVGVVVGAVAGSAIRVGVIDRWILTVDALAHTGVDGRMREPAAGVCDLFLGCVDSFTGVTFTGLAGRKFTGLEGRTEYGADDSE